MAFAAGLRNPLGVKLGPSTTPRGRAGADDRLNPDGEPGRLTLITRMGAGRVREALPPLIRAVTAAEAPVAWVCDPMHGNTFEAPSGYKTRRFDDVLGEVQGFFEVHRSLGPIPAASTSSSPGTT